MESIVFPQKVDGYVFIFAVPKLFELENWETKQWGTGLGLNSLVERMLINGTKDYGTGKGQA